MKDLYIAEVRAELEKFSNTPLESIAESDIAPLPEPVQKYFRYCGYLGQEKMVNAEVIWREVNLKLAPNKKWMRIKCYQFNSVIEPTRIVYMKSRIMGLLPFEGRDKCQAGQGNMTIKLFKFLPLADVKGRLQIDQSALVTVLAETFLVPTYALQPYIQWTAIDSHSAKAVLSFNYFKVSGTFYFNDLGEFTRFETYDRYYTEQGTEYKKMKWSAFAGKYVDKNGIKFPSYFRAIWHTADGEYEYFNGKITDINFNVKSIKNL